MLQKANSIFFNMGNTLKSVILVWSKQAWRNYFRCGGPGLEALEKKGHRRSKGPFEAISGARRAHSVTQRALLSAQRSISVVQRALLGTQMVLSQAQRAILSD